LKISKTTTLYEIYSKKRKNKKLARTFYATYNILRKIGEEVDELDFPSSHIYKFYLVSFLKKGFGKNYVNADRNSRII
jgi:hypothetical protein